MRFWSGSAASPGRGDVPAHAFPATTTSPVAVIQDRLALPGAVQMLLQLGVADTAQPTARRPPEDVSGYADGQPRFAGGTMTIGRCRCWTTWHQG